MNTSSFNPGSFLNIHFSRNRQASSSSARSNDSLDTDLESSFASNVSLNSPPQNLEYGIPMDISPLPPTKAVGRPRSSTSAARMFGNDVSNKNESSVANSTRGRSGSTHSNAKRIQRSALPMEWLTSSAQDNVTVSDDAMDVDPPFDNPVAPCFFPVVPHTAAPTVTTFANLFFNTASPGATFESPSERQPKKRRSLSPEAERSFSGIVSSSPELPSSPSDRQMGRIQGVKPFGIGLGPAPQNVLKRPRRPVLSALVQPSDLRGANSAFPILAQPESTNVENHRPPPVRRAFSAMIPSSALAGFSDESSFEGPDGSSPAQAYAQRQQVKTIRRCDGTDDFRPMTGVTAMVHKESPAKLVGSGLPGFGDNERMGKILPCHRVPEDGLMRISPQTLNNLLDGQFSDKIHDFHIIDCRFDYEYAGGHIPGAVNINSKTSVEDLLLGPSLTKPKPSVSGDEHVKTVLVFHCEFSAQRAPTFAKHLRSKDRAANHHVYPKIHYPEVYILEGGYCNYFKSCKDRCEPRAYVTMDDPKHAASRREDLDQFRKAKFGRHKSYAYGDSQNRMSTLGTVAPKRNTVPNGGSSHVFAAGNAARTRRGGASLVTLVEDSPNAADADGDETDIDIEDSPCPPPVKREKGRNPLTRAETYGPSRMPY